MRIRNEKCQTKKKRKKENKKTKKKKKTNKLKVAPTTTRNDKQRKKNGGKKYFCVWNKYDIIKQVRENQDEVHEVYPIDQVKLSMEHMDIQVEM